MWTHRRAGRTFRGKMLEDHSGGRGAATEEQLEEAEKDQAPRTLWAKAELEGRCRAKPVEMVHDPCEGGTLGGSRVTGGGGLGQTES